MKGKYQNIKIKYTNALKIEQERQMRCNLSNARVYAKHKTNLTWAYEKQSFKKMPTFYRQCYGSVFLKFFMRLVYLVVP